MDIYGELLEKRIYIHEQPESFVRTDEYMIVEREGKRYIALRFVNRLETALENMTFVVLQLSADGSVIEKSEMSCECGAIGAGEYFNYDRLIKMRRDCRDFRVVVLRAVSGRIIYTAEGGRTVARYDRHDPTLDEADPQKSATPPSPPQKHRHLIRFLAILTIAAILVAHVLYTISSIAEETERRLEEIEKENGRQTTLYAQKDTFNYFPFGVENA